MSCNRKSTSSGWERARSKYQTETNMDKSPVNPIYAHLIEKSILLNDRLIEGLLLATMLSEENHYINIISLISRYGNCPTTLLSVLKSTRININWIDRIDNIKYIGKGFYGNVYQAKDQVTNELIAIKNIIPKHDSQYSHFLSLWKILFERNVLITSNECPFIVNLKASFKDIHMRSFWLVMEYCPVTLDTFMLLSGGINRTDIKNNFFKTRNMFDKIDKTVSKNLDTSYKELLFVYLFEILYSLDYLASRHIVYCDIKSDNVLIGMNGHIKITDVGAAQRFRLIDKKSALYLMDDYKSLEETINKIDNEYKRSGNVLSLDPESLLRHLKLTELDKYKFLVKKYKLQSLHQNEVETRQTFLTDLYAVGALMFEAFSGGLVPLATDYYDSKVLKSYNLSSVELEYFAFPLAYKPNIFKEIILQKLNDIDVFKPMYEEIYTFIARCFKPRAERNPNFLRDIQIFRGKAITIEKAIDLGKVENLKYYKKFNVSKATVNQYKISDKMLSKLKQLSRISKDNSVDKVNLTMGSNERFWPCDAFDFMAPN